VRRRFGRRLAELLYRLRTEADTPGRQSASIAIGVFIGCLPLYGLHLALCVAAGTVLRLNRLVMYLAANLSNPLVAPLLVAAEIQLGAWLLRGRPHPLEWDALRVVDPWMFAGDLAVGSVALGAFLGAVFGVLAWTALRLRRHDLPTRRLLERAAHPYLEAGFLHWEFVRGKLLHDPVYLALLEPGLLPDRGSLWDLGCGRGIALALLRTASRDRGAAGVGLRLHGMEADRRAVRVARRALAGDADLRLGDLRTAELPRCRAVLLIDVLHYLGEEEQASVLRRATSALEPGGVLVVREVDLSRRVRALATRAAERLRAVLRGRPRQTLRFLGVDAVAESLRAMGLRVESRGMSGGTPFANSVVVARAPGSVRTPGPGERCPDARAGSPP